MCNQSSSSQAILVLEGGDGVVLTDEDKGRRNNKEYTQQSERSQEANWSSVSGELHEANTSVLDEPEKTSLIEANLETVAYSKWDVQSTRGKLVLLLHVEGEKGDDKDDEEGGGQLGDDEDDRGGEG